MFLFPHRFHISSSLTIRALIFKSIASWLVVMASCYSFWAANSVRILALKASYSNVATKVPSISALLVMNFLAVRCRHLGSSSKGGKSHASGITSTLVSGLTTINYVWWLLLNVAKFIWSNTSAYQIFNDSQLASSGTIPASFNFWKSSSTSTFIISCWNKIGFVQCLLSFDDNKVLKNT